MSKNLDSICKQLADYTDSSIELIVSDNASVDDTSQVVTEFIDAGFEIKYFRNHSNMGFDFNFKNCVLNASGKYVWLFGDDDILLPNSLNKLINLLKSDDFGSVYLNALSFDSEENTDFPNVGALDYAVYSDALNYYNRINYFTTFITGNIFNKDALKDVDLVDVPNTNLIQLTWIVPAIFSGAKNLFINTPIVAAKAGNTGGYKLITTFAKKYNIILSALVRRGYNNNIVPITNNCLLNNFFPQFIFKLLYEKSSFEKENGFYIMFSQYWNYLNFWRKIFPIYAKFFIKKLLHF